VALVAARLMDGYRKVGRPQEGVNLLRSYLAEASSIDLIEVVFKAVIELDGVEAAKQLVVDELRRNPTLLGLDKLLEARMMDAPPISGKSCRWSRTWCTATPRSWRATSAAIAASRRASSTGSARAAAAGKPTRRAAPKNSM
jgi:lipopolysaccharide biosynthesis regulator YciM